MTIREYDLGVMGTDDSAVKQLQMHIDTLESFRNITPHPEELEWEIRLYCFMQKDGHTAKRLDEYNNARYDENDYPYLSKHAVVAKLGWDVP